MTTEKAMGPLGRLIVVHRDMPDVQDLADRHPLGSRDPDEPTGGTHTGDPAPSKPAPSNRERIANGEPAAPMNRPAAPPHGHAERWR